MDPQQANLVPPVPQPQPIDQQFAGVMPAQQPGKVPGVAPSLSQDDMRNNLEDLMAKIDSSFVSASQGGSSPEDIQVQRDAMLREVFDMFTQAGVDPNNVEEVRAFLDEIKATNPRLYMQIEKALSTLIGEEPTSPTPDQAGMPPEQNMNINPNENIQQDVR